MHVTLAEVARLVKGKVSGDEQTVVRGIAPLDQAQEGDLTLVAVRRYVSRLMYSPATAVLVDLSLPVDRPAIRVPDPLQAFVTLLEHFFPPHHPRWQVDPRAVLAPDVVLGEQVSIGPYVVIGRGTRLGARVTVYPGTYIGEACDVGSDCVFYPNVSIYSRVSVGRGVIIHSGAVIGADGFGFRPSADGSYRKIPQVGRVTIGDWVEIGANTCVDRATVGETVIETGVKLDNLVQIGHNTTVGAHTVLAGQAGLAGSVRVGARVRIGGQVGVADHVTIGEEASIVAQTGVPHDVEPGAEVMGSPAMPHMTFKRRHFYSMRLEQLFRQVRLLQKRLQQLEKRENRA